METRTQSTLASGLTMAVGLWLLVTPLFISMTGAALANILVVGAVIALIGLVELFWTNTLPSWLGALTAVWLFASVLLFDMSSTAAWNMALFAIATFVISIWEGLEAGQLQQGGPLHQA